MYSVQIEFNDTSMERISSSQCLWPHLVLNSIDPSSFRDEVRKWDYHISCLLYHFSNSEIILTGYSSWNWSAEINEPQAVTLPKVLKNSCIILVVTPKNKLLFHKNLLNMPAQVWKQNQTCYHKFLVAHTVIVELIWGGSFGSQLPIAPLTFSIKNAWNVVRKKRESPRWVQHLEKNQNKTCYLLFFPLKRQAILDTVLSHHWSWIKVQNLNAIKIKQIQNMSSQKLHIKSRFWNTPKSLEKILYYKTVFDHSVFQLGLLWLSLTNSCKNIYHHHVNYIGTV
jgi:hypothetical protein